jgi:hypothetical protein
MMYKRLSYIFLVYLAGLCGCVSLTEKAGQVLDRSAFAEKNLALWRAENKKDTQAIEVRELQNKAGGRSIVISLAQFPALKIRGSAPDSDGAFFLTSLNYLGGSVSGWNEFTLDLSGGGIFLPAENQAAFSIPQAPEGVQISSGKIRRYDTRITGNDALTSLRNRRERILVLGEWMRGREGAPAGADRDDFEDYWKPVLLPELVSKKKRPPEWQKDNEWVKAEDINWNKTYTEQVFPEQLWAVRNSGTLLRDWEEAFEWIYFEYEWERITGLLSRKTDLQRIK